MSVLREYPVMELKGLNERASDMVQTLERARYARELENLRPEGGIYRKVRGNTLHSTFAYQMANRPITLIRYATGAGVKNFVMTAWDNVFKYSGGAWVALGHLRNVAVPFPSDYAIPRSVLFDEANLAQVNRIFSWLIYKDILYMTDGYNLPIKVKLPADSGNLPDGSTKAQIGTWGFKVFTDVGCSTIGSPLLGVLSPYLQTAAGLLSNVTFNYKVSLYDSTRNLTGNASPVCCTIVPGGALRKFWLAVNMSMWSSEDNYICENEFADKIKIWRSPANGADISITEYYLAATLKKGIISYRGTISIAAGTGVVTGVDTYFQDDGIVVGDALWVETGVGVWNVFQVSNVTNNTQITVLDADGTGYTFGAVTAGKAFRCYAGFVDNDNDYVTGGTMYHEQLGTPEDHSPPPRCKYCCTGGDRQLRAFLAGDPDNPNRLYWSTLENIDYWDVDDYVDVAPDDGDEITGLIVFQGRLYIFKRNSVAVMSIEGAPTEWAYSARVLSVGASDQRVIADCGGVLVFANPTGVYAWTGSELQYLSHREDKSNIIKLWDKVVLSEITNVRAVYHAKRNEYWLAVCFDDARGLYDSGLTGLGHPIWSPEANFDDAGQPDQNNGILVYCFDGGDWFFIPHIHASCFEVYKGRNDLFELYRGGRGCAIYREDVTENFANRLGDSGFVVSSDNCSLTDTVKTWETDEWIGAIVYLRYGLPTQEMRYVTANDADKLYIAGTWASNPVANDSYVILKRDGEAEFDSGAATGGGATYLDDATGGWDTNEWQGGLLAIRAGTATAEWCVVSANTATRVTGTAGSFNGVNNAWTINPAATNLYWLVKIIPEKQSIHIKYRSPMIYFDSMQALKEYFEMLFRMFGTGTIHISWTVDGLKGGSLDIDTSQGAITWGNFNWGATETPTTLMWSAIQDTFQEINLPDTAEGRCIEVQFELDTESQFDLYFWLTRYKVNTGKGFK